MSNTSSTQIARPDSASHWYITKDDKVEAFHEVPYAGKRGAAGEKRPTTLRDARKVGAVPSVTNILSIFHKEHLTAYKINQAILASLTLPRIDGESEDDFAKRVFEDSKEHAASAARLGSRLHEVAAQYLLGDMTGGILEGERVEGRDLAKVAQPLKELFQSIIPSGHVTPPELSEFKIHNPLGYAGTCDGLVWLDAKSPRIQEKLEEAGYSGLLGGDPIVAMADLKSRGSSYKKATSYETDILQLAAYLHAVATTPSLGYSLSPGNTPVCNILVNTHHDADTQDIWGADIIFHPKEEVEKAWAAFQSLLSVWKWAKGYDPVTAPKEGGAA